MITRRDSRDSSCLREIDALLLFRDGVTGMRSRLAIRAPIPLTTSMHSTVSYLSLFPSLLLSFSLYSLLKTRSNQFTIRLLLLQVRRQKKITNGREINSNFRRLSNKRQDNSSHWRRWKNWNENLWFHFRKG